LITDIKEDEKVIDYRYRGRWKSNW